MKIKSQRWAALAGIIWSISVSASWAQPGPEDAFNGAFYEIYMDVASRDVHQALHLADSLNRTSKTDVQRIRSLLLIGDMHHRMARRDSSVFYAEQAAKLAERTRDYEWQARIYGVLSTQLREMGLIRQGKKYLDKGVAAIDQVAHEQASWQYRGLYHQELGFYAIEEKDAETGLMNFRKADSLFGKLPESPALQVSLAQNHERLGWCYVELGQDDSAKFHYERALELEPSMAEAETPLRGFIYNGLGMLSLRAGDNTQAYTYLTQAQRVAETTEFTRLKIAVYRALSRYYREMGDTEAYMAYNDRFVETQKTYSERHKEYVDHAFLDVQARLANVSKSHKFQVILFSCCLTAVVAVLFWIIRRQRRQRERFKALIRELRATSVPPARIEMQRRNGTEKEREVMPESTKELLINKLDEFERNLGFRDKNMSIAVLAGKLKTNTKYLSYIINNIKNTDFNTYINELRIRYIMEKMREDERYLNYKISYLAEECGFSSHSQFATVFRNVTGLSPSKFISLLQQDIEQL